MDNTANTGQPRRAPSHAELATLAYAIFIKHGSYHGDDVRNWLDAEMCLQAQYAASVQGRPALESCSSAL